jgi:hypothetical protein
MTLREKKSGIKDATLRLSLLEFHKLLCEEIPNSPAGYQSTSPDNGVCKSIHYLLWKLNKIHCTGGQVCFVQCHLELNANMTHSAFNHDTVLNQ